MTATYPSSTIVNSNTSIMTAILASLANAPLSFRNNGGGTDIPFSAGYTLSSSPGFMVADGSIVINGSTVGYSYGSNTGGINGGNLYFIGSSAIGVQMITGPAALVAVSSDTQVVYLVGAVLPPLIGGVSEGNFT